jgi:alkane 1-monooxygenase
MTSRPWNTAKVLGFSLFPAIPMLAPLGYYMRAPWLGAAVVFVGLPLLDVVLRNDRSGTFKGAKRGVLAWLYIVPQLYVVTWAAVLCWAIFLLRAESLAVGTAAWLVFSVSLASSFATCAAHELLHWPEPSARAFARLVMATVAYGHFTIEHVHHHATVGIAREGTTPPLGQSVWVFFARNVAFSFRSAWDIERQRQIRSRLPILRNRFVQQWLFTAVIATGFVAVAGLPGLAIFVVQAAFGVYTTEYVNYAQHYGLARNRDEPLSGHVSWSSNGFGTNSITLNITRHAHHHLRSGLRYYELEHIDGAPILPAGYLALFFPAMVPAIWRKLMDQRAGHFADAAQTQSTGDSS